MIEKVDGKWVSVQYFDADECEWLARIVVEDEDWCRGLLEDAESIRVAYLP